MSFDANNLTQNFSSHLLITPRKSKLFLSMNLQRLTVLVIVLAVTLVMIFFFSGGDKSLPADAERPFISGRDDELTSTSSARLKVPHRHVAPAVELFDDPRGDAAAGDSYQAFFLGLADAHFGPLLLQAIYDPDIINAAVTSLRGGTDVQSVVAFDNHFVWDIFKLRLRPVSPEHFRSPAEILILAKQLISIGLGRFHRDKQMSLMYQRAIATKSLTLFKRQVRRILTAYASYFHTVMQLAIDGMDTPALKDALRQLLLKNPALDPLTIIMTKISYKTRAEDVVKMLQDVPSIAEKYMTSVKNGGSNKHQAAGANIGAMFPLEYDLGHFDAQRPINGKFWNMIRPTASCSSLVRLCEVPDGCRLLCNAEYLMEAGKRSSSTGGQKFFHRIAGFGSNNEYDWETSLHRMFQKSTAISSGANHEIGWITVFDCTLGSGKRMWAPPKELTESDIGFGHASKCCDALPSDKSVTLGLTKALLLKSEQERIGVSDKSALLPTTGELVTRYHVSDAAMKQSAGGKRLSSADGVHVFDDLTILKLDIEGYEFNVLPKWGRDELRCLGETAGSKFALGSDQIIDFDTDCLEYFTVSLLSMEFHRSGHKGDYGARINGALRAHYTLLHAYSLGYVMVGQERNHQDNCCYEVAWVHYRHFVRSEMWMLLGD